jgi:small subunit ribosomal protein S20
MPNTMSAKKRVRQNAKRRERNRAAKSAMKTSIKKAVTALDKPEATQEALSVIGRTSQRGVIHRNKAARLASRLQRKINAANAAGSKA